jgi:RNA polymerase sigma-70 factor (ECF subfamily)
MTGLAVSQEHALGSFEAVVLPHLDAAFNLARWLTRNPDDASDVVQESMVRALRGFGGYSGQDARAWLLAVVRNTCYTWLGKNRRGAPDSLPDADGDLLEAPACDPAAALVRAADGEQLRTAIEDLPVEFREVFVLRELEGLSYKQIAAVGELPIGTVMSRLSRARLQLQKALTATEGEA